MAVHNAIRSNPSAQPQRARRRPNADPHQKTELFDTLRHLNRGYGAALAALGRLGSRTNKKRLHSPGIFPTECLNDFRNRTEALRATINRDLLRLFAGREDHDAERYGRSTKR